MTNAKDLKMTPDALLEKSNRTYRDQLVDKTDVLDRVKVLTMLPDDLHVTVEMAANYYGVSQKALEKNIERDFDELCSDGLKVLSGEELREFKKGLRLNVGKLKFAPSLTLIPRRAVLRIGMLLRDSEVAKTVRSYLLNVEQTARRVAPEINEEAIEMINQLWKKNKELTGQVTEMAPKAEKYDKIYAAKNLLNVNEVAKVLNFEKVGRNNLFKILRHMGLLHYAKSSIGNVNLPYQKHINSGLFEVTIETRSMMDEDFIDVTYQYPVIHVTQKGVECIRALLLNAGFKRKNNEKNNSGSEVYNGR